MAEVADRYRRLSNEFAVAVAAVPEDRWTAPSPCDGWNAREVVQHVVDVQGLFLGFVGRGMGDVPPLERGAVDAWLAASATVQALLDDPAIATQSFEGAFGETTFESAIDRFANFDLVVHRWDLARATGGDESIAAEDAERVIAASALFGPALRSPGVCGPEIAVASDADATTRMLAIVGRRA